MEDNARPVLANHGYTVWKLDERDEHGFLFRVTVNVWRMPPEVVYTAARLRDCCEWIDHQFGSLYTYPGCDYVRAATPDEARMSAEAGRKGIPGVFTINGHRYYVTEDRD